MAEVLGRVLQPLVIRETPSCSSLVGSSPATIHGVVPQIALPLTESQRAPHPQEDMLRFLRNRSVRLRADVQDQHAVLGYIGNPEVIRQVATLSLFRIFDVAIHHHIVPLVGGA